LCTVELIHRPHCEKRIRRDSGAIVCAIASGVNLNVGKCFIIFTEKEQILLVESIDVGMSILVDDTVRDVDGPTLVRGSDPIERETTWKTGDGTEQALESLRQVVWYVVFINLDDSPPRSFFVLEVLFPIMLISGGSY
jgi:hypothetical protein